VVNEVLRTSIDICTPIELNRKLETLTPPDNTEYLSMAGEVVEEYEVKVLIFIILRYINNTLHLKYTA